MDQETLTAFESLLRQMFPTFQVKFKEKSLLMKALGVVLYPFCPTFMSQFVTTIGSTVYFPKKLYKWDPRSTFLTLAHEMVHVHDRQKHGLWFTLSYLLPQLLALVPLVAFAVLAWPQSWIVLIPVVGYLVGCLVARWHIALFYGVVALSMGSAGYLGFLVGWPALLLAAAVVLALPWPSPWRTRWEVRGYSMNVAVTEWMKGTLPLDRLLPIFGSPYYFMSWSQERTRTKLSAGLRVALSGQEPYGDVKAFLKRPQADPKPSVA